MIIYYHIIFISENKRISNGVPCRSLSFCAEYTKMKKAAFPLTS